MSSPIQRFWLAPQQNAASLRPVRIGMSLIAAWYFVSHWADIEIWFAADGVLSTQALTSFLQAGDLTSETTWRWSPLFLISDAITLKIYLILGLFLAVLTGFIRRTRLPAALLWLWAAWLANRSLLIAGPEELALCFGLGYLAIASPKDLLQSHSSGGTECTSSQSWTTTLSRRLLQVHTSMLMTLTGLMMLSSKIWWDGSGSVSLAAPVGRRAFELAEVISNPMIYESITHIILIGALVGPLAIWFHATRRTALNSLVVWCLIMAILSSQWMYLATLAVLLQSFRTIPSGEASELITRQ